jgi:Mg-chelatase subunit ChlD
MKASGSTNLSEGLLKGIEQLRSRSFKNHTASILLFTDGVANFGITDKKQLVETMMSNLNHIPGSVSVFTFGFSGDHDEV